MKRLMRWGFSVVLAASLAGCAHRSARYCGPYRSHCEGLFDVICRHHANDWGKCDRCVDAPCGTCSPYGAPCGPVCEPTCPPGCQPAFHGLPSYPLPTYGSPPVGPGYAAPPAYTPYEPAPYEPAPIEQPVPEPMDSSMVPMHSGMMPMDTGMMPMDTGMMPMQAPGSYGPYMSTGVVNPQEYPQMHHQPYASSGGGGYPAQNCENCQPPGESFSPGPVQMAPPISNEMPVPAPPAETDPNASSGAQLPPTSYWRPTAHPHNISPVQDASAIPRQGIYRR